MKKLIVFLSLMVALAGYSQKKPVIPISGVQKVEYSDIKQILDNKDKLELTRRQIGVLTIKNEYIKRDLQFVNSQQNLKPAEIKMYERDLKESYQLFIERTLTDAQLKEWGVIQKSMLAELESHENLKADLKTLEKRHKENLKEIYTKYRYDRKLYYAQRSNARRQYETNKLKLISYYKALGEENGEEVMSLEEIANLYKEYDDYYNNTNTPSPLNYLEIQEEGGKVEEAVIEEGDF